MAFKGTKSNTAPSSPRREDAAPPAPAPIGKEESLDGGNFSVRSMNHCEEFRFTIQGAIYQEWMPRLSRNPDGLVPVLPCTDLDTGEQCLLIMPGMFQSWVRREKPAIGTKLCLRQRGKDPETGAWKLTVERL